MASTTKLRASALPTIATKVKGAGTYIVVPNFAVFIDTHRDQPHVPTFEDDIHRGMARPTIIHYIPPNPTAAPSDLGQMMRVEDGKVIPLDPKHRFVEVSWWEEFIGDYVMTHGVSPVATTGDTKGQLPTSHLRNARTKVYKLKSLRQVVRAWEKASAAVTGTPFKARAAKKATPKAAKSAALYAGPMVTDHPFLGIGDKACYWPIKVGPIGFPTQCGIAKEGHL